MLGTEEKMLNIKHAKFWLFWEKNCRSVRSVQISEAWEKLANQWRSVHLLVSFMLERCRTEQPPSVVQENTESFPLAHFFSHSLLPSGHNWSDKNSPLGSVVFPAWVETEIVSLIGRKAVCHCQISYFRIMITFQYLAANSTIHVCFLMKPLVGGGSY